MPEETTQKPVGPFEDFEACVAHFDGDPEVDDPQALCGWMEQNKEAQAVQQYAPSEDDVQALVDAMKAPEADAVLTDLQVTYVSGVENPAQDSQWVMAKDADAQGADWGVNAPLLLQKGTSLALADESAEQQKAWAAVLIPDEVDKQGDVIPADAIEKAAHQFLATYRKIDTDHDLFEGKGTPIESWTLKEATTFTLPDGSDSREYPKGTWMMGVRFSDEAWERIKSGELTGFSIYGEATSHEIQEILGGEVDLDVGEPGEVQQQVPATAKSAGDTAPEADPGGNTPMDDNDDDGGDSTEKQLPADVLQVMADSVDAYLAADDTEPDEASLGEFIQWGLDSGEFEASEITVGGVTYTAGGEDEDGGEEADEDEPEETEMDDNPEEGGDEAGEAEEPSVKEMLEEVRDTVRSTKSSVESHGERLEALEDAVFEKGDGEGAAETAEGEGEAPEAPDVDEAAEKAVKSVLGLEDLPDDPEERQQVLRKHLHEQDEGSTLSSPDDWNSEDTASVVK